MLAVIMAGGSGTRFWPLSRKTRPKQFLKIAGREPMLVETCNRLKPLIPDEDMVVILGREHRAEAETLFAGRPLHVLAEPLGRNTAPCIGLGAVFAQHLDHDGPVAFLPADHFIGDQGAFLAALKAAGDVAADGGIVTLGIVPHRPETGYGYIRRHPQTVNRGNQQAYRVLAFVEKPDLETAEQYMASGEYYWNAGIFVATPQTILQEIERHLPGLHRGLSRLRSTLGTEDFEGELSAVYPELESISFDYGIMERTRRTDVYVLPCRCGWSDVGSWASLYELREAEHDRSGNLAEGDVLVVDCRGTFAAAGGGRLVACLGLTGCLVVDTPDCVLVADLGHAQAIRKVVEKLKEENKEALL